MGPSVQVNDSGVVNHFRVHDEGVPGLHDLVVAVVAVRQHGRPGGKERQAPVLQARILRAGQAFLRVGAATPHGGRRGRQGRNATIGRVGDDGGAERFDGAGAELAEERVVGARAGARRRGLLRGFLVAFSDLAFPRRGFRWREEGFVLQRQGAFERRRRGGVPDAVEARMRVGTGTGSGQARTCQGQRRERRDQDQSSSNHRVQSRHLQSVPWSRWSRPADADRCPLP